VYALNSIQIAWCICAYSYVHDDGQVFVSNNKAILRENGLFSDTKRKSSRW